MKKRIILILLFIAAVFVVSTAGVAQAGQEQYPDFALAGVCRAGENPAGSVMVTFRETRNVTGFVELRENNQPISSRPISALGYTTFSIASSELPSTFQVYGRAEDSLDWHPSSLHSVRIDAASDYAQCTAGDEPPTEQPTPESTPESTPEATQEPTPVPTDEPTPEPTGQPTVEPTQEPTIEPTEQPTEEPFQESTPEPTEEPTPAPTDEPTPTVTDEPDVEATQDATPTPSPTLEPTDEAKPDKVSHMVAAEPIYPIYFVNSPDWSATDVRPVPAGPFNRPDGKYFFTYNGEPIRNKQGEIVVGIEEIKFVDPFNAYFPTTVLVLTAYPSEDIVALLTAYSLETGQQAGSAIVAPAPRGQVYILR